MKLGVVVTGHGEVTAVPVLVRRIAERLGIYGVEILKPFRLAEGKVYKDNEIDRALRFVASQVDSDGGVLVLLDADMEGHDCPATEAPRILSRARQNAPGVRVEVVMAKREYEAWFLAGAESIAGKRTLPRDLQSPADPETIRDAKGWLGNRMARGYSETVDQPALSALVDLDMAQSRSRSFDKLVRSVAALLSRQEVTR